MDALLSSSSRSSDPSPFANDGMREERDIGAIKDAIRKARDTFVYTDFDEAVRLSRPIALKIVDRTKRPIFANISRHSVFIHLDHTQERK